jgi:NDP-sugar pyrophosphorylase family protein
MAPRALASAAGAALRALHQRLISRLSSKDLVIFMQCLILAGGLATRMRPVTETIPKSLIPVGDEPFAFHQLRWLAKHGVTEVVYSIGYKGEMIREELGDGSRFGIKITYVDEGKELRGTGGAVRLAFEQGVLAEKFLITYGDSYLPIDFAEVWSAFLARPEAALMTVYCNDELFDASNVIFDAKTGKVVLYQKGLKQKPEGMRWIDYGLLAIRRDEVARGIPSGEKTDLSVLFHQLSLRGELSAYEIHDRFYEIGSFAGLADLKRHLGVPDEAPAN